MSSGDLEARDAAGLALDGRRVSDDQGPGSVPTRVSCGQLRVA
jgi:hypothetical protein